MVHRQKSTALNSTSIRQLWQTTAYAKWKADALCFNTIIPATEYEFTVVGMLLRQWNIQFKIENADVDKNTAGDKVFGFLGIKDRWSAR